MRCIVLAFLTTAAGRLGTEPALADQVILPVDRILLRYQHILRVVRIRVRLHQVTAFPLHLENAT